MTVAELIEHLRRYPLELPVLVEGFETGWDGIHDLRTADVDKFNKANEWDGEYREAKEFAHPRKSGPVVLIIGRRGERR